MILAIAVKHLVALGATSLQVQSFIEEAETHRAVVNSTDRERRAYLAGLEASETQRRDAETERKRAYREKQNLGTPKILTFVPGQDGTKEIPPIPPKENNIINITPVEGECEGETPVPAPSRDGKAVLEQRFNEFWEIYPKKSGKGAARAKFMFALKKATSTQIMNGLRAYIASKPDPKFTKNPATWLNHECWLDEYDKPKGIVLAGPWKEVKSEPPRKPMTPEEKARREEQIRKLRPGSIKDQLRQSLDEDKGE
jgi:hypothetical protein